MHIVVFVTAPTAKLARSIAEKLVAAKLAACVNVVERVQSVFFWQGKIEKSGEALLVIKSKKRLLPRLVRFVRSLHSYEVPEIIALPVVGGYRPYLRWIDESVG